MHKTSPLKKNSFTVWLHFRVLNALLTAVVDAILPIVLSAMSDRHRALLSSVGKINSKKKGEDRSGASKLRDTPSDPTLLGHRTLIEILP
jgi:hypothetical protein